MRKAELSIQFIFLIFIATITSMVIIALIVNWAFDIGKFSPIDPSDEPEILDTKRVYLSKCNNVENEIVKHVKLCSNYGKEGWIKGELCYALFLPRECVIEMESVNSLIQENEISCELAIQPTNSKIIISYDYDTYSVRID